MKLENNRYGLYGILTGMPRLYEYVDIQLISYDYGIINWKNQKSDDLGIDWTERKGYDGDIYHIFSKDGKDQAFWHAQQVDKETVMVSGYGDVWFKFHN